MILIVCMYLNSVEDFDTDCFGLLLIIRNFPFYGIQKNRFFRGHTINDVNQILLSFAFSMLKRPEFGANFNVYTL